nr:hypothetical protein BgiMline_001126 [Biomphalaria glabrata]
MASSLQSLLVLMLCCLFIISAYEYKKNGKEYREYDYGGYPMMPMFVPFPMPFFGNGYNREYNEYPYGW